VGVDDSALNEDQRKALLLWLNSTLGVLSYYGRRAITEGAWMQMKKPAWSSMLVLDVRRITAVKAAALAKAYDDLAKKELAPIAQLDTDVARHAIDAALCKALSLPNLAPIRVLLSREPGLSAHDIGPLASDDDESGDE
jgi:hypothetical protein